MVTNVTNTEVAPLPGLQPDLITLTVKEQRELSSDGPLRRVAIGDSSVADVVPITGGALLVGKKPGVTSLSVWSRNNPEGGPHRYNVRVRSELTASVLPDSGLDVSVHGSTAVISGDAPSLVAHARAAAVAADSASSVVDVSNVAPGGVVQVDVKVVEFTKSVLKEAGFNLFTNRANGFGFGVFGATSLTSVTAGSNSVSFASQSPISSAFNLVAGPIGGIFANLSVLQSNGLARVLAEPTLVALSGQSASFLAGGELPIPESGGLGTTTITYKSFGVGLTVTPTVLSQSRIALKVAPEASDLDYGNAVTVNGTTIPAITTRRADTTVELGDGESFVIGGLVSRSTATSVGKVPLLGDLPIIGAFFKNMNYTQSEKELVIIVTPHIVQPIARGVTLPLPGDSREVRDGPVWGSYVVGPMLSSDVPGFSH
ncbi:MAG: type II and III secretion system protein family protein [Janthinobacterium lividum]